jgi:hypothetical protein
MRSFLAGLKPLRGATNARCGGARSRSILVEGRAASLQGIEALGPSLACRSEWNEEPLRRKFDLETYLIKKVTHIFLYNNFSMEKVLVQLNRFN